MGELVLIVVCTLAVLIGMAFWEDRSLPPSDWLPVRLATDYGPSRRGVLVAPTIVYLICLVVGALAVNFSIGGLKFLAVFAALLSLFLQQMHWLMARLYFKKQKQ